MKRRHVWIGAGVLFAVLVGSGFVPDLRLASDLRKARQMGLLDVPPLAHPAPAKDAASLYRRAASKFGSVSYGLQSNYSGLLLKAGAPLRGYLAAMSEASKQTECSPLDFDRPGSPSADLPQQLFLAARANCDLARDEESLMASARMARHLADLREANAAGRWSFLVERVLDRAQILKLAPDANDRLKKAMGPPLGLRDFFKDHVGRVVQNLETEAKTGGRSVSRARTESTYLHFWTEFLETNPDGPQFLPAVLAAAPKIEQAEAYQAQFVESVTPGTTTSSPWANLAQGIEKANLRLSEK